MSDKRLAILSLDYDAVNTISNIAASMGYAVSHFKNTIDFYTIFDSLKPTLLIIDLSFGETDGVQLLSHLSSIHCHAPIILIGKYDLNILHSAMSIGLQKKLLVIDIHNLPIIKDQLLKSFQILDTRLDFIDSSKIAHAMESKQFTLHYQPKIAIKSGKLIGIESLIRWQPPNTTILSPDSFIIVAEKSGLIVPMTYWIIKQSLEEYRLLKLDEKQIIISINLSRVSLTDPILPDEIVRIAREYNIDPQYICFEITESATREQPELVLEILTRLRIFGFKISIDDFGTGYSSLFELKRLPFTELKIDKSFIFNLENNSLNQSIVKSIAYLSHNLNMTLVAEGVESKKCFNLLKQYKCDIAQGFLISKALPAGGFEEFMNSKFDQELVWDGFVEEEST